MSQIYKEREKGEGKMERKKGGEEIRGDIEERMESEVRMEKGEKYEEGA